MSISCAYKPNSVSSRNFVFRVKATSRVQRMHWMSKHNLTQLAKLRLDDSYLSRIVVANNLKRHKLEARSWKLETGRKFNPASSVQLPALQSTALHRSKDLAVSLPLCIPMAELDQFAWDKVPRFLSKPSVTARTSCHCEALAADTRGLNAESTRKKLF